MEFAKVSSNKRRIEKDPNLGEKKKKFQKNVVVKIKQRIIL
jgi:hypothetical protein